MAMNPHHPQDEIVSDINMTPLSEVMLVLLIIFMVSSSAAIESGLDVNLPESSAVADAPPSSVTISLKPDGQIAVGGEIISREALKQRVTAELSKLNTTNVVLEGDGEASLTSAFEIMNIAREAGAKDFSIAAKMKGQ